MVLLCGSMAYMFWSGYCTSRYGLAIAHHNSSIFPYSLTGERRPLLHHYMSLWFKGFKVGVDAGARCMSSLTQQVCTPASPQVRGADCTNLVPAMLTWHTTL
jgi:hypothetical protein